MKKIKLFALAVMAMLGTNAMAQAVEFYNGQLKYETVGTPSTIEPYKTNVTVKGVNGEATSLTGEVSIPGSFSQVINGRTYTVTVTGIQNSAFQNALMTKVTLPKELKSIGTSAFVGCTNLVELAIESGSQLTTIGDQAFATTHIAKYDFTNCTLLQGFPANLFTEKSGVNTLDNTFVTEVKMPTSAVFTDISTSLSNLSNLATTNLKDTKITSVKASAFAKSAKLTTMELPATVQTIATDAFKDSKVATLTIDVTSITTIDPSIYGTVAADQKVPTSITLKGELTGTISALAFNGLTNLTTLNLSGMSFGTNAKVLGTAFNGLTKITSVTIGNIGDNATTGTYTIAGGAFTGCTKLATVEIGNITANEAIDAAAFGSVLETLTIGNVISGGLAINDGAFVFADDKNISITVGDVRATSLTPVIGDDAFTLGTSGADCTVAIQFGAVSAAGGNFDANGIITNAENYVSTATGVGLVSIEFTGAIAAGALDAMIFDDASALTSVTFDGAIATGGLADLGTGAGVFYGMPSGAVVTFNGVLAQDAIGENAFEQATPATDVLTVIYTATPADASKNPFKQKAFNNAATAVYPVVLKITNADLAAYIRGLQDANADAIYRVGLVQVTKNLIVFQKTGTNTAYGRFEMNITNFPNGLTIDRHQGNVTFTLYTTYVEDDAANKIVTINMQPIPSLDGKYRLSKTGLLAAPGEVVIVKATGVNATETEMAYTDFSGTENPNAQIAGLTAGTQKFAVSAAHWTNNQLVNKTAAAPFADLFDVANGNQVKDIYFLSNPSSGNGISATAWNIKEKDVYVAIGSYYVVTNYYPKEAGARVARIVWNDGSEETTAIQGIEKNAVEADVIFNLAGQKVDANYKGIVIKNGKKMIQK